MEKRYTRQMGYTIYMRVCMVSSIKRKRNVQEFKRIHFGFDIFL